MFFSANKGFTLIEILIVVVIISILVVLGVQMLSSGSVERNLRQQGNVLSLSMQYACDQAIFQNRIYGVKLYQDSYEFSQYANNQWTDVSSEQLTFKKLSHGFTFNLFIEEQRIILPEKELKIPQIVCDTNGMLTPFKLTLADLTKAHHFQLSTIDSWKIQGKWLENKNG